MTLLRLFIIALAFAGAAAGCSSATLNLDSTPPKAQVTLISMVDGKTVALGETPLTVKGGDLLKQSAVAGPVYLEFKKEGHFPVRTIVTDLSAIDLTIKIDLPMTSGLEDEEKLNEVVDMVFEGQRLGRAGRTDDALARLKVAERTAPALAATYEIEGAIYYLQKKYKEALDAYAMAVRRDPKSAEAVRMRNYLMSSLGVKPSTEGPADPGSKAPGASPGATDDKTGKKVGG